MRRALGFLLLLAALPSAATAGENLRTATRLAKKRSATGETQLQGSWIALGGQTPHTLRVNKVGDRGAMKRKFVDLGKGKVRLDRTDGPVWHGGEVRYNASLGVLAQRRADGRWSVQQNKRGVWGKAKIVDAQSAHDAVDGKIAFASLAE